MNRTELNHQQETDPLLCNWMEQYIRTVYQSVKGVPYMERVINGDICLLILYRCEVYVIVQSAIFKCV
jgi:hypothetical protein